MNEEQLHKKIIDVADKYGDSNPQQLKQMVFVLQQQEPDTVFEALNKVFLTEDGDNFRRQQFAGKLLCSVKPKLSRSIESVITPCLATYNLSVEELPFYLRETFGEKAVIEALSKLAKHDLNERQYKSLNTMHWWLTGKPLSNG